MPSVLFVCTANICRSPMAAALFVVHIQQITNDWRDWRVESAGTWVGQSRPAALEAQKLMKQYGKDISRHLSREVSAELLGRFNLILTMEPGQKEALKVEFPQFADRIFLLSEMSGMAISVMDPVGQPISAFQASADQINWLLHNGMERILYLGRTAPKPGKVETL